MKNLAVMAIPSRDDYVWNLSSEKVPHMTLLYLGDQPDTMDTRQMEEFIQHVVDTTLHPFGMSVDRRGELGDKNADVLYFSGHNVQFMENFRHFLLTNEEIYQACHSTDQYPSWTPHLTLGYPETPARPDKREYPGVHWVNFDRIALWTGNYEGVEFPLKNQASDIAMSTEEKGERFVQHFGVKGMKWGVINDAETSDALRARSSSLEIDAGINTEIKKAAVDVSARMDERYGFHIGAVKLIPKDHQEYGTDTMGFVEPAARSTTSVSTIYVTNGSIRSKLKYAESIGWFAKDCGNEKVFLTHESAHALFHVNDRMKTGFLGQRLAGDSIKARDKAMRAATKAAQKDGISVGHLLFNVSGYAYSAGTRQELEAEMFSQYHWQSNPPRFVKVWGETLHHELGVDPTPFREEVK